MLLFTVGLLASLLGAVSGLGGGVVIKPVLDALTALDMPVIDFLSVCSVFSMALAALGQHLYKHTPLRRMVYPLGLGAALGGILGAQLLHGLFACIKQSDLLKAIQNSLLFLLLAATLLYLNREMKRTYNLQGGWLCLALGLGLGLVSACLGIGGGPINMAVLSLLFSMSLREAAVHSMVLILCSQAAKLTSILLTAGIPLGLEPAMLWQIIPAALLGGVIGSRLGRRLEAGSIRLVYNGLMLFVLGTCLWNTIRIIL